MQQQSNEANHLASMPPYEKYLAAQSILQMHILAQDSACDGKSLFGVSNMPTIALELAERLFNECIEYIPEDIPAK